MKVNFVFLMSLLALVACNMRTFGQEGGYDDEIVLFEIPVDSEDDGGDEGGTGAGTGSGNPKCYKYTSTNSDCQHYINLYNVPVGQGSCGGCNWDQQLSQFHCATSQYLYTTAIYSALSGRHVNQGFDGTGSKFLGNYRTMTCFFQVQCGGLCIAQDPNVPPTPADCPTVRTKWTLREPKLEGTCP
jgi:hypothetical protein